MKWQPYPSYKDSGEPWLAKIPAGWSVIPLKRVTSCNDEVLSEATDPDYQIEYVDISSVSVELGIEATETLSFGQAPSRARRCVKDGDIIVSTVRTYLKAIAPISRPVENLVVSTGFAVIRPTDGLSPAYARYALQASYFMDEVVARSVGVSYPAINASDLVSIKIALPPLSEQQSIATFLERETAKLDTLIAKQERLIQLAEEKRQAIISQAVTKGLNPDVSMKDSGVEWLGSVPVHWDVKQIKRLSRVSRGASPRPIDDPKYFDNDGEYGWVRIADVTASGIYLEETTQKLSELGSSLSVKMDIGQLFISIAGTVGKPCISGIKCCIHDGFVYFPDLKIKPLFIYYIFEAGEAYKGLGKMGTQLNLNTDTVGSIKIGVPPDHEINQIIAFIHAETKKADRVIEKSKNNIELMREHRTALISAAVTGKIDVREAA